MYSIEELYALRDEFKPVVESADKEEKDPVAELEQKIEDIKVKETRGFISKNEAKDEIKDLKKKLEEVKKELKDDKKEKNED